jgi:hypothetical protein
MGAVGYRGRIAVRFGGIAGQEAWCAAIPGWVARQQSPAPFRQATLFYTIKPLAFQSP